MRVPGATYVLAAASPAECYHDLVRSAGWLDILALGVALIVLGVVALGVPFLVSLTSVLFFGWLLVVCGAMQTAHGFWRRAWSGFFLDLLAGVLYLVVGFMFIDRPLESLESLTLIIAAALMFVGIMRIFVALSSNFQHWVWLLINGVVSLILGVLMVADEVQVKFRIVTTTR